MKLSRTLPVLGLAFLGAMSHAQFQRAAKQVPYQVIQTGQYSNAKTQSVTEISDSRAFRQYWAKTFDQQPGTEPQNLNWVTEKVVVVQLGRRNTSGYKFFVGNIEQGKGGQPIIRAIEQPPVPGSFVDQTITSPWIMMKVPNNYRSFKLSVITKDQFNGGMVVTPDAIVVGGNGDGGGTCTCNGTCSCGCGCGQ